MTLLIFKFSRRHVEERVEAQNSSVLIHIPLNLSTQVSNGLLGDLFL